jgi:hypothetical protein
MGGPLPRPVKPATASAREVLRFILAVDAEEGTILELDMATGKLVPASLMPVHEAGQDEPVALIPSDPPPGMWLRALADQWRDQAQQIARGDRPGIPAIVAEMCEAHADMLDGYVDQLGGLG